MRLLPDVGLGFCHLAALVHFRSTRMAGTFPWVLISGVAVLWEGWGWREMRVKGEGLTDSQKENLTTNTKPPTGSKQDGQVATGQDPLGSCLTSAQWHSSQGFPLLEPGRLWEEASILKIPVLTGLKLTRLFPELDAELWYHSGE